MNIKINKLGREVEYQVEYPEKRSELEQRPCTLGKDTAVLGLTFFI